MKKILLLTTLLCIGSMNANFQRIAGRASQNKSNNYISKQIIAPIVITALFVSSYLYGISKSGTAHMSTVEFTQALMEHEKQQKALKQKRNSIS